MLKDHMCFCGKPLHYSSSILFDRINKFVKELGRYIEVSRCGKKYKIDRHFIALHGLKPEDFDNYNFEEIKE